MGEETAWIAHRSSGIRQHSSPDIAWRSSSCNIRLLPEAHGASPGKRPLCRDELDTKLLFERLLVVMIGQAPARLNADKRPEIAPKGEKRDFG
jgi:hypothetical protein